MVEIYLLGTGCAIPQTGRGGPGIFVKGKGAYLFDLGRGSLDKLTGLGFDFREIGYLFFSHYHPDHTAEIVSLLFAYKDPVLGKAQAKEREFRIYGPQGLKNFYAQLKEVYGSWIEAENYDLILNELKDEPIATPDGKVLAKKVAHAQTSAGYRLELESGKKIVYSGDTGYCEGIVNLAKDADLLILECALPEEREKPDHLTPSLAGKIAEEARVSKLVLTHFYPLFQGIDIYERCRKYYSGEIVVGKDLMKFVV